MQQDDQQLIKWCVVLDMDGVLCENLLRREYGDDRDYELFGKRCGNAAPIMDFIALAQIITEDHGAVFILTARSEKLRTKTLDWLRKNGVEIEDILMRPLGNREPDHVLKRKMLTALARKHALNTAFGPTVLLAVDDTPEVVKMYRDAGLPAYLPGNVPEVLV